MQNQPTVTDLYRQHNDRLVAFLSRHLQDDDLAAEAAQFAWLTLIEKSPSHSGNIYAWLCTVAVHEAYRIRRTRRETPVAEIREAGDDTDMAAQMVARLDRERIRDLLNTAWAEELTENQRLALTLWSNGLRYQEIAAKLDKSYTWVNRHITEGRARLRRFLKDALD